MNVLVIGPCIFEGMAGSKRLYNNLYPLFKAGKLTLKNLVISDTNLANETIIPTEILSLNSKFNYNFIKLYLRGFNFIKQFDKKQINIFLIYGYPNLLVLPFITYANWLGYKIVYDIVEDIDTIIDPKNLLSRINIWITKKILIRKLSDAAGIITITDYLESKISAITKLNTPICNLPISVDLSAFEIARNAKNNPQFKIFYGGSFGLKDGLQTLLEAINIMVYQFNFYNFKLVLTGKGSARHMNSFWNLVKQFKMESFIEYKGYIPYSNYLEMVQSSDVLCIIRNKTKFAGAGFPFKLGEFLASGKPVIVTRTGEIEKYVTNESVILLEPEDPKVLAKAIMLLINDKSLCLALGQRGRLVAEEHFSSKKTAEKLQSFLNSL